MQVGGWPTANLGENDMAAGTKPNLGLTEGWADGDVGWGSPMNGNMTKLDAIVMLGVIDNLLQTPPTTPAEGDRYIVGTTPTGIWVGHANAVAVFDTGNWLFLTPKIGWTARSATNGRLDWNGTAWTAISAGLPEAPEDGTLYARKNGTWTAIGSGGGIADAPADGTPYAREDNGWVPVTGGGASALHDLTDVTDTAKAAATVLVYDTVTSKWIASPISLGQLQIAGVSGWDAAHMSAGVTLSSDTFEATIPNSGFRSVHGVAQLTTKAYFEYTIEAIGTGTGDGNSVGLISFDKGVAFGPDAGYNPVDGGIYSGGLQDTIGTAGVGDVIGVAYDPATHKFWVRINGGTWMGTSSFLAGNPVGSTGGQAITPSASSTLVPIAYTQDTSNLKVKINCGGSAFQTAAPTGYSAPTSLTNTPSVQLQDVSITTPADGHVITYDAATRTWKNKVPSSGGISDAPSDANTYARKGAAWVTLKAVATSGAYGDLTGIPVTMKPSGSGHAGGLVPDTPASVGTTKYLREDGTWTVPPDTNTTYAVFGIGTSHSTGLVPDPGNSGTATRYLREDGTWVVPSTGGGGGATALSGLSDVAVSSPTSGQLLKYNSTSGKWENASVAAFLPYDIPMFFPGIPANNQRIARIRIARAFTVSAAATHYADADAAATAAVSMPLKKNGTAIGAVTFALGSATGAITFTADVTFAAGDTLTWDNQATTDVTLGNISATILGLRAA